MVLNHKSIVSFLIVSISLLTSVIVFFYTNYEGYELLFLHPLTYIFVYSLVLSKTLNRDRLRLFFIVLIFISFLRYVLLPLLIVISEHYGGRSFREPNSETIFIAILLMNYELIVYALFIAYKESKSKRKTAQKNYMHGNKNWFIGKKGIDLGYILFIMLTIVGISLYPSSLFNINFIFPTSLDLEYETSLIENLVIYSILISKQLIFIMIVRKLYLRYLNNGSLLYIYLSFLVALFNILIYSGTNRSDILISALISFLVLYKLYGKVTKKYMVLGALLLFIIINIVTQARDHMGISRGTDKLIDTADTVQVYTGGVYNVSIAIETNEIIPDDEYLGMLFFDIFRPMIGVNIFVKDLPFQYSNIFFNKRMWLSIDRRSQILPMIGQGFLYFGFFLAPIFGLLFINLFYFLERKLHDTNSLEIYYFLSLVMVRLGFLMGQNTMNMINDMSMNLVLFLIVYYFNKFIKEIVLKK